MVQYLQKADVLQVIVPGVVLAAVKFHKILLRGRDQMRVERQGLIVWYRHRRNLSQIRRHGHLVYASRRMRYAVLYVNKSDIDTIEHRLQKLPFVKKEERSYKKLIRTELNKKEIKKAKEYDFHIGI